MFNAILSDVRKCTDVTEEVIDNMDYVVDTAHVEFLMNNFKSSLSSIQEIREDLFQYLKPRYLMSKRLSSNHDVASLGTLDQLPDLVLDQIKHYITT